MANDPTIGACILGSNIPGPSPEPFSSLNTDSKLKVKIIKSTTKTIFPIVNCNIDLYNTLDNIKSQYNNDRFLSARNATNPFENIGLSTFFDRASVKLANIDAIFDLTSHQVFDQEGKLIEISAAFAGLLAPQSMDRFTFCDVAGGPGGWTQYLQYRRLGAEGLGITLKDKRLSWNEDIVDMDRFQYTYGEDDSGNLYVNSNYFINYVLNNYTEGVDLVCADGGFDVQGNERMQETLTTRLILCECLVAIKTVKENRHFVCKVFDTVSQFMSDLIYCVSLCFKEVFLFKPMSSRPANSERYLVCKYLISSKRDEVFKILDKVFSSYSDDVFVSQIFESLPVNFEEWITEHNNLSLSSQIEVGENILRVLKNEPIDIPMYNLYKALMLWNIPDNNDNVVCKPVYPRRYKGNGFLPRTTPKAFKFNNTASEYKMKMGKKNLNLIRCNTNNINN